MPSVGLETIERKLLALLQRDFPLVSEPYMEVAQKLGISEAEVIQHIQLLKTKGVVRQISPVLDARRLGYQSTLVAMKVAKGRQEQATRLIAQHPGVSHGYERDHEFNIWFTLSLPGTVDADAELRWLTADTGAEAAMALPAVKVFKIGAFFDADGEGQIVSEKSSAELPQQAELTSADRRVINVLQQDLPLTSAPFDAMAVEASMDVTEFLSQCQSLIERGIMRRFGASINHRRAGFQANAMSCWVVSPEVLDSVGWKLASVRAVSHCYERKSNLLWPYNLFAMVHRHHREDCRAMVDAITRELGLRESAVLFSTREFKKTRIRYQV